MIVLVLVTGAVYGRTVEWLDWDLRWGKRSASGLPYLVDGHLIDTGLVLELLWDNHFEQNTRDWFEQRLGALGRQRLALLAASHDCGKLAPTFQCRLLDARPPSWAPSRFGADVPGGVDLDELRIVNRREPWFLAHGTESGRCLARLGAEPWWSRVVEGHHGRFPPIMDEVGSLVRRFQSELGSTRWPQQQLNALLRLVEIFAPGENFGELDDDFLEAPAVVLSTGWVSIADWLASDESAVAHGMSCQDLIDTDLTTFIEKRRAFLAEHVERSLGQYSGPASDFASVFGFPPSRPVQSFVSQDSPDDFCILAVPMGAGKTEAALERHRRLGSKSLYFALPTMATADAMFERVREFYKGGQVTTGALLHGRSSVNDFYAGAGESGFEHAGDASTGLVAGHWLRGRHRGLLSPVGVGTVDQVFAAVLRAKYATVRLAAISNTHIVFDEAHSYDPYQQQLFCTVLRWMGLIRAPVTVLSATLPTELAHRFAGAYADGWNGASGPRPASDWTLSYPGAVSIRDGGAASVESIAPHDHRVVSMRYLHSAGEVVDTIVEEVRSIRASHPAATIGVVLNRVAHCISVAAAVSDMNPLVLHARMPTGLRAQRQREVASAVGPDSIAEGQLVVGTQVLEQSLDLDFDFLVSEFAPAPDLIQRTGRLWRHSRCEDGVWAHPPSRTRGGTKGPELVVVAPPSFEEQFTLPYMPGVLASSWLNGFRSGGRSSMVVPEDLQDIVDCSHVTFSQSSLDDPATLDLLAAVRAKRATAKDRSLPLADLIDDFGTEVLVEVTRGGGSVEDERATRWQEEPSETVALVSSNNPWTLHSADVQSSDSAWNRRVIDASLSLSGAVLRRIEGELQEFHPPGGESKRRTSGRYLQLDSSKVAVLDAQFGLIISPKNADLLAKS